MTHRMTIAKATRIFKETKGTFAFNVISFNRESDPCREYAYGGTNLISAFSEMTKEAAKGRYAVLVDQRGWDFVFDFEIRTGRRIRLSELMPYIVRMDEEGTIY